MTVRASDAEQAAFVALTERLARERRFVAGSYKDGCLRRRIAVRMRACGVHDYAAYAAVLDRDPAEWDRLLDALTINVTQLFRDPDVWEAVAAQVLPALWPRPGTLRWWSAGCSTGEEPYTLATLARAHAERTGRPDEAARVRILGTDIDARVLEAARRGSFDPARLEAVPAPWRERYFAGPPVGTAAPALRALVRIEAHDLLRDPPPPGPFELICCRNVIIYFDRPSQEALLATFRDALAPGGVLLLGRTETLLGRPREWFEPLEPRHRLFRKAA